MSSYLADQTRSFKGEISSAGSKLSQKRGVGPSSSFRASPAPSASSQTSLAGEKRKRPDASTPIPAPPPPPPAKEVVYSQPADTGTGHRLLTRVTYAIEYLKGKDKALPYNDIYNYLSIPDAEEPDARRRIEQVLKGHSKVEYDPKGFDGKGSFRFRPVHNVRSADDLLAFLQRQPTAQGIPVKELKEGWPGAIDAIESLEKAGRLLVTRNKKDGTARSVWPDDPTLTHKVDKEFQDLWHKVKVPGDPGDLRKELVEFGLTPTSLVKDNGMKGKGEKKKKRAPRRGGKTTNTHMRDILKDYSGTRPGK